MIQSCLQVRQCRCSGLVVPPSRAAVPQDEFDKGLSVCIDMPIHPPSRPTRDPTEASKMVEAKVTRGIKWEMLALLLWLEKPHQFLAI